MSWRRTHQGPHSPIYSDISSEVSWTDEVVLGKETVGMARTDHLSVACFTNYKWAIHQGSRSGLYLHRREVLGFSIMKCTFLAMRYTNLNIRQVVDFFWGGGKWRHTSSQLNCKLETNSKFFGTSCWHLEHQDTANFLRKVDRGLLTKLCFDDSSLWPDALQ